MDRFARGVVPGVDISSLNLHSVRETALGAFLDLENGITARAVTAIRNVLALQYPASDWPWSGTFPVTAEQHDPPGADAIEWVHYDPNWRQFLGCILALTVIHHEAALPDDVRNGIDDALSRCVRGEPETRIAAWYTNPNLMHAWLLGHVGQATGDADLIASGEQRAHQIMERFERFGDIDEYNSPTYDGIDLFALALWVAHPPTPTYERSGAALLAHLGSRISDALPPPAGCNVWALHPGIRARPAALRLARRDLAPHRRGVVPVDPADDARPGHGARPRPVLPAGHAATPAQRCRPPHPARRGGTATVRSTIR